MSGLGELVQKKTEGQIFLAKMLASYGEKYMRHLYENIEDSYLHKKETVSEKRLYRDFQKYLVEVSKWSESKRKREYHKFLKWTMKRYEVTEMEIQTTLDNVVLYSVRIMLNRYDFEGVLEQVQYEAVKLEDLLYNSLKRISRFYYEQPHSMGLFLKSSQEKAPDKSELMEKLQEIVVSLIHGYIPLQPIIQIMERQSHVDSNQPYDFNQSFTSSKSNSNVYIKKVPVGKQRKDDQRSSETKRTDKQPEEPKLRYISSDEYNEYYHSDQEKNNDNDNPAKADKVSTGDNQVKHIDVPKRKVYQKYK
ncbi:MAG: hypothetical protein EBU90_04225 [Proteobacteria bacterium]|nr:hypothetical protein [Pseudomonadota bacterium]NBP13900.1 hypothetical protein [bacterium]